MKSVILSLILSLIPLFLLAQENNNADSTKQKSRESTQIGSGIPGTIISDTVTFQSKTAGHSPEKAGLYSAILPGLGQAYNGKYWKIPLIYGGAIALGAGIVFYNDLYNVGRNASIAIGRGLTEENPLNQINSNITESTINARVDSWRRNRDFMIILSAALYGLNIMDAVVDAHLKEFEVNEDLSLDIKPSFIQPGLTNSVAIGLAFTLNIK